MIGTLAGFRAFALDRGNSAPTDATDAAATAALVRAGDYIQLRYLNLFQASCSGGAVAAGYDPLTMAEVGAYIAAGFELTTPDFFSSTYTPSQQKVLTGAGSIKWTVVGDKANGTFSSSPMSTLLESLYYDCVRDPNRKTTGVWAIGSGAALGE